MKRFIDIIGSIIGLIILAPFIPFIALAIKLDSFFSVIPGLTRNPGLSIRNWIPAFAGMINSPVFVKLDRVSKGKIVKLYKFRSMVVDAQKRKKELLVFNERRDGPFFKIKNDPRITKSGKILRKFLIDEFPQLFNVLRGELSLVGPRPHEPEELFSYPEQYKNLLLAKAGMTGLSQINGASNLPFLEELKLDSFYIKNQSLWLDFKILFKTLVIFLTDPSGV